MRIPKPYLSVRLSVCPHPEKRNPLSFVNISPTLVIDVSIERSSQVLHHGNPKIWKKNQKSLKFEIWLLTKSWNHPSFVNISPTLVIDASMERSSRVLQHGNPNFFFLSSKFEFWLLTKSWNHRSFRQYQSYIRNWYINGKVFMNTTPWKSKNLIFFFFFFKVRNSNFDFWRIAEITLASSISVLH